MTSLSFSLGGNGNNKANNSKQPSNRPSSTLPSRSSNLKRDHSALLDDASSDEESATKKQHHSITHFDVRAGGAVDSTRKKEEEKKPLVIAGLKNRDWREESARKRAEKYGIVAKGKGKDGQGAEVEGGDKVVREKEGVKYGLNVFASATLSTENQGDGVEVTVPVQEEGQGREEPKTAEQVAIDALLGHKPDTTLTIPAAATITEEELLARDMDSAPRAPTLEDYAAVPVEEFGAAMLRGMGWKGPSSINPSTTSSTKQGGKKQPPPPAKRPALLGIGADPNAAVAEELGAWGRATNNRRKDREIVYNPLVLRNPKTGERVTEDELKGKIQVQKEREALGRFVAEDEGERRSKRDDEGERRSKRDDEARRRGDDGDRRDKDRHHRPRRRERSPSHEKEKEKRHTRDKERNHHDGRDADRDRKRDTIDDHDRKRHRDSHSHGHSHGHGQREKRYDEEKSHGSRRDRDGGSRRYEDDDRDRRHRSSRR